jgi:transposase-like protein
MHESTAIADVTEICCPSCHGEAIYRYGRIQTGAQRFLCLICDYQFTLDAKKSPVKGKPTCPECGKSMNVYKLEGLIIRFRCSGYPVCKSFRKYSMKEEK